jgi:ATP-dependent helicase/nuclease subunit B
VPEQSSLQAEQALVKASGGKGLAGASVLSFRRLAHAVFAETGAQSVKPLDDDGKRILIKRALISLKGRLDYFAAAAASPGFVSAVADTVSEFARYNVTPESLRRAALGAECGEGRRRKLTDLHNIIERYNEMTAGAYLTGDGALGLLAERVGRAESLKGALVWVDGFSGFTAQEYRVIEELLRVCGRVSFAVASGSGPLFDEPNAARIKIREIAERAGAVYEGETKLNANRRHAQAPDLAHLEAGFFSPDPVVFDAETRGVEIYALPAPYEEAEFAARRILKLLKEGYALSDIAVVGGGERCAALARAAFERFGLPVFFDAGGDVLFHPLIAYAIHLARIAARAWRRDDVLGLLKTRVTALSREETDKLENYVLARGIKNFAKEWEYGFNGDAGLKAEMNRLRGAVYDEIAPFAARFSKGRHKAEDMAAGLYGRLVAVAEPVINAKRESAGVDEARGHARAWEAVVCLLDKTAELLGDEAVCAEDFRGVLEAALEGVKAEGAPPALDMIIFGDIRRVVLPDIKALFVLGANDGLIPAPAEKKGAVTDEDRAFIEAAAGVRLSASGSAAAFASWFELYVRLMAPSRRLFVLYSLTDGLGKKLYPSVLIQKTLQALPRCRVNAPESEGEDAAHCGALIQAAPEEAPPPETLKAAHGEKARASVSRLEAFARCPFSYFMRYTLRAGEREVYELATADIGTVFHAALESFARGFSPEMSRLEIERLAADSADAALSAPNREIFESAARYRFFAERIKETAARSALALADEVRGSGFRPYLTETPVSLELPGLCVEGFADRVDLAEDGGGKLVRVVDYKSGASPFSFAEIYHGLKYQLLVYLKALSARGEGAPAGALIFRVYDPAVDYEDFQKGRAFEKAFAMSGVSLGGPDRAGGKNAAVSPDEMERLIGFALEKAAETGERIARGEAAPAPFSLNGRKACDTCPYTAVCGEPAVRRLKHLKESDAKDAIIRRGDLPGV